MNYTSKTIADSLVGHFRPLIVQKQLQGEPQYKFVCSCLHFITFIQRSDGAKLSDFICLNAVNSLKWWGLHLVVVSIFFLAIALQSVNRKKGKSSRYLPHFSAARASILFILPVIFTLAQSIVFGQFHNMAISHFIIFLAACALLLLFELVRNEVEPILPSRKEKNPLRIPDIIDFLTTLYFGGVASLLLFFPQSKILLQRF